MQVSVNATEAQLVSTLAGTGTYLPMTFYTGGSERMRVDTSGNVGIGVVPSAWRTSDRKNLQVDGGALSAGNTFSVLYANAYLDASAVSRYVYTGSASNYAQSAVGHVWSSAISGTAGDPITFLERMRIDSNGNLLVGSTGVGGRIYGVHGDNDRAVLRADATNASFTQNVQSLVASRAANSAYTFLLTFSGAGADVEHNLRGDGNAFADGTWQNNGADYAEFFESANGQALTLGATVVLDGNKVREATEQDPASAIIGVVRPKEPSKASMMIGNTAWNKWANKYLSDDFDRYIMEDHDVVEWEEQVLESEATEAVEAVVDEDGNEVSPAIPAQEAAYKTIKHSYESHNIPEGITVPEDATVKTHDDKGNKFQHYKLNPAWDKDAEYTPREQRPEWNIIGLLGQVKILKGQPVGDRWVKMRNVSSTVEEWFIR
jgi:hypothetical protein